MVLFVIVFIDPWLFPLYSGFSGSIEDEITIAIAAALFGTAVWWGIGWAIGEAISIFRGKMKLFNQSALPPAANVMTAAGAPVGPPFGAQIAGLYRYSRAWCLRWMASLPPERFWKLGQEATGVGGTAFIYRTRWAGIIEAERRRCVRECT